MGGGCDNANPAEATTAATAGIRFPAMHGLRLFLALLVVWDHAHYIVGRIPYPMIPGTDPGTFAVWAFFFLSGFLVTNSWLHRSEPLRFAVHRAARIWPALAVALLFSSLVAAMSVHLIFPGYRQGIILNSWHMGHDIVHDSFPGAYPGTRYSGVLNGSLWSLRWEMGAYLFVLVAGVAGVFRRVSSANLVLLAVLALLFINPDDLLLYHGSHAIFNISYILAEFLLGMLVAVNLKRMTRFRVIAIVIGVLLAGYFLDDSSVRHWSLLVLPALLVFFVSIAPLRRFADLRQDLSYGTYVYAWPVEQYVNWRFPGLSPMELFLAATPVILVIAAISWRYIEQPALDWAKRYRRASRTVPVPTD